MWDCKDALSWEIRQLMTHLQFLLTQCFRILFNYRSIVVIALIEKCVVFCIVTIFSKRPGALQRRLLSGRDLRLHSCSFPQLCPYFDVNTVLIPSCLSHFEWEERELEKEWKPERWQGKGEMLAGWVGHTHYFRSNSQRQCPETGAGSGTC